MQHNILFFFACLNFEFYCPNDLQTEVAAMRRKGVVFSKMFVLRSMGIGTVISVARLVMS